MNTTLTPHSITHGDACFAYFNKIWDIPDTNFDFACNKIKSKLNAARTKGKQVLEKIEALEKELRQKGTGLHYFRTYLAYLDRNSGKKIWAKKIPQDDGLWIASFHQADYTGEVESAMEKTKTELGQFRNFVQNLNHYSDRSFDVIQKYEERLRSIDINKKYDRIRGAVIIMKKYVSLTYRVRNFLSIKLGADLESTRATTQGINREARARLQ